MSVGLGGITKSMLEESRNGWNKILSKTKKSLKKTKEKVSTKLEEFADPYKFVERIVVENKDYLSFSVDHFFYITMIPVLEAYYKHAKEIVVVASIMMTQEEKDFYFRVTTSDKKKTKAEKEKLDKILKERTKDFDITMLNLISVLKDMKTEAEDLSEWEVNNGLSGHKPMDDFYQKRVKEIEKNRQKYLHWFTEHLTELWY